MVIDHIDQATRHIYLASGVRAYHPVDDIYKEIRQLRRTDESLRGFDMPVTASGNVPKGGGKFTPRYSTFRLGWKIVPEDISHVLFVAGEQITDEGEAGPACIDFGPLSPTSKVIVQYEPPSAEIIETGVSGLTAEESDRLMEVEAIKAKTDTIEWNDVEFIKQIGQGRWQIVDNQMIFYEADNLTEIMRFNLKNQAGEPAMVDVFERVRV